MNKTEIIELTEIDRERWRFILYRAKNNELYGRFSYQPSSFVETSMLIKLNEVETQLIQNNREELLKMSDQIRNF